MSEKLIKQKKVVVYLPEEDYKLLRIKLLQMGETVSGWFRKKVKALLSA